MKNFVLNVIILFALIATSAFAQPKLEIIGGDTYDWGNVKGSQNQVKAKIQIKNAGTELLKISNVHPTCGCTTAPLDKNELKTGEIATLDVTLNLSGKNNEVTKSVRIKSNDPNAQEKILWLKVNIVRDLQISSTYIAFQEMTVGYEKDAKVSIKNNSASVIKLSDFAVEPDNLNINLKGTVSIKPGQEVELVAKATPKESGNFRGSVKFKTSDDDNKEVVLSAFGKVKDSPIFNNAPGANKK